MAWVRAGQVTGEPNDAGEFDSDVSVGSGAATVSSTTAHTGTYSIRNGGGYPAGLTFAAADCVRVSFWFRHNGVSSLSPNIVKLRTTSTVAQVTFSSTGNIALIVDGSTKETKTSAECGLDATNSWTHCALTYYVHASTGYVTFYVDGVAVLSWDGTVAGAPTSAYVGGGSGWAQYTYFDDLYVDTSSAEADACPEALRFLPGPLDADTVTDMTIEGANGYTALATNDGDTSYVGAVAAAVRYAGEITAPTIPDGYGIRAVIVYAVAERGDAASKLQLQIQEGVDIYDGAEQTPGLTYGRLWERFTTPPDATPWTEAHLAATLLGLESAGTF